MVFEYEDALRRPGVTARAPAQVDAVLDYFCSVGHLQQIFYLWRPLLPDPKDDMLLELAVAAECQSIVTYNLRHFVGVDQFGVSVLAPAAFLAGVGVLK